MYRRCFLCLPVALSLTLVPGSHSSPGAAAQEATPASGVADLGLPEVVLTIDDGGFALPDHATAGRALMTVRNTGSNEVHFFAARIPDAVTDAQLATEMQSESEADPPWFDMTTLPFLGTPDWPAAGGQA